MRKTIILLLLGINLFAGFKIIEVQFEGNRVFNSKFLMEKIQSKVGNEYNEYVLRHDELKLLLLYRDNGYFDVEIKKYIKVNLRKKGVSLKFKIKEGMLYPIKKIEILGNFNIPRDSIISLLRVKKGGPYDALRITLSNYAIMDYYSRKGFAYANVRDTFVVLKDMGVIVKFLIEEGKRVYIKDIQVENRTKIRESVLKKYITLKKGEIYNPEKVTRIKRDLLSTHLFGRIETITEGELEQKDSVVVKFILYPSKLLDITFGGGFLSPEWLIAKGGIVKRGILGGEHRLKITGEYGFGINGGRKDNIFLTFTSRDILYSPFNLILKYKLMEEVKEYHSFLKVYEGQLGYTHSENRGGYISIKWKDENTLNDTASYQSYERVLSFHTEVDFRNNPFDPTRGIKFLVNLAHGGGFLGGDNNFQSYLFKAGGAIGIGKIVLEIFGGTGKVFYTALPTFSSLFYTDGRTTVRGLPAYSVGEIVDSLTQKRYYDRFKSFNFQVKYRIIPSLYFIVFYDGLFIQTTYFSYGFGINYITPVGPLRLEFGVCEGEKNFVLNIGGIL